MPVPAWAPDAGDLIWIEFDPVLGNEQGGRRPALVVSEHAWNSVTQRAVVLPVTSRVRGWPSEVVLPNGLEIEGAILVDQLRTVSWQARGGKLIGAVSPVILHQVRRLLSGILGLGP